MANTSKRGFASMDTAKQREIASKGGRAAHAKGTAHEFTTDEARVAGRKGGEAVSRDRRHMSTIGREGGHSRGARARAASQSDNSQPATRGGSDQAFERQSASDRGSENASRGSERDNRIGSSSRTERSPDNRFAGRDEI